MFLPHFNLRVLLMGSIYYVCIYIVYIYYIFHPVAMDIRITSCIIDNYIQHFWWAGSITITYGYLINWLMQSGLLLYIYIYSSVDAVSRSLQWGKVSRVLCILSGRKHTYMGNFPKFERFDDHDLGECPRLGMTLYMTGPLYQQWFNPCSSPIAIDLDCVELGWLFQSSANILMYRLNLKFLLPLQIVYLNMLYVRC